MTVQRRYIDGYTEECETRDLQRGDVFRVIEVYDGVADESESPWLVAVDDAQYDPERGVWSVRSEFAPKPI